MPPPPSPSVTPLEESILALECAIPHPTLGLPDEVFRFVTRLTPMINVDLLIKNPAGQTLLTWRDAFYDLAPGWHFPGGIIRFKESWQKRIHEVARLELHASVSTSHTPIAIHEIMHDTRAERGHFISLLFACTLTSLLPDSLRADPQCPIAGQWAWFDNAPENLLTVHNIYTRFINHHPDHLLLP